MNIFPMPCYVSLCRAPGSLLPTSRVARKKSPLMTTSWRAFIERDSLHHQNASDASRGFVGSAKLRTAPCDGVESALVTHVLMDGAHAASEWAAPVFPETQALISTLLCSDATAAISVWHPRTDPAAGLTSHLKTCNQAFRDLCDVAQFADGRVPSVLVVNPLVFSPDTAHLLQASLQRFIEMVDAVHQGELMHVRSNALHLSRLGRQKKVKVDMIGIQRNGVLVEYMCVETLLPPDCELHIDATFETILHHGSAPPTPVFVEVPRSLPSSLAVAMADAPPSSMFSQWVFTRYGIKSAKWTVQTSATKKRRLFSDGKWVCVQCNASETTQRRCAATE